MSIMNELLKKLIKTICGFVAISFIIITVNSLAVDAKNLDAEKLNVIEHFDEDILGKGFRKYGSPIAITPLCVHKNANFYEYQPAQKLYSLLESPQDTLYVSQIVFKNDSQKLIVWTTMANDSIEIVDALEFDYHNVKF